MDAHDLFKKLAVGVKFDTKRFRKDAERFQVINYSILEGYVFHVLVYLISRLFNILLDGETK